MRTEEDLADLELLHRLQNDDAIAFAALYERYWPLLWNYASHAMRDRDDAKDIVQEVFSNLWESRRQKHVRTSLSAYLYRMTMYKIIDNIRRTRQCEQFYADLAYRLKEGVGAADSNFLEKELIHAFEGNMAKVPEKARKVFELRRHSGMSYDQIGREMNISRETVKSQMKVALKVLKKRMLAIFYTFF